MRTLLNDPPEPLLSWLEQRRLRGQDRFDEMWEGVYHVAPAPHPLHGYVDDEVAAALRPAARAAGLHGSGPMNVGQPDDYRVPDRAFTRGIARSTFVPSVSIVVEIVSPKDETWEKLGFYFARGVQEVLIVDPRTRSAQWFARGATAFETDERSALLGVSAPELIAAIEWPSIG